MASLAAALGFAASAGVATFLAPCAFPLLPGYVGYYLRESDGRTTGLGAGVVAALGALLALVGVGAVAVSLGRAATSRLPLLEPVVGLALVAFGVLTLLDRGPEADLLLPDRPESALGFGVFGAGYALAAAGCVVPLFLGVVSQGLSFPPVRAGLVLLTYALGVAVPLLGVTLLAGVGVQSWRDLGRYTGRVRQVAAVVMILAGLGQIYLSVVILDVL